MSDRNEEFERILHTIRADYDNLARVYDVTRATLFAAVRVFNANTCGYDMLWRTQAEYTISEDKGSRSWELYGIAEDAYTVFINPRYDAWAVDFS